MTLAALRAVLLAAAGAGLVWWGMAPRLAQQSERADRAEQRATSAEQQLAAQQAQAERLSAVERQMRELGQTVTRHTAQQRAAFEELKRNDQAVADYLRAAVPAALGRLYARPETTDPAAYRSPALPADPVPPAGAAGAASQ